MSDYKPTDAEVRHEYVMSFLVEYQQDASDEFDRWLAEHDAALIEGLADEALPTLTPGLSDETSGGAVRHWLREKARQRREEQ